MRFGMNYEQGEIVLIPFPFSDLSSVKQRPVLILSNNDYNNKTQDIVVCGITSNLKESKYSVLLHDEDLIKGKLPLESIIKSDKLFTLKCSLIIKQIGKLNKKVFDKVISEILKLIKLQ
jgi:mRNA interferase MazF